jgi:8-oxo-dGTP pyrophosphatase MutT (NUDIX family)
MAIPPGLASMLHDGVPVTPREAASVLLIDAREAPWRVLMMRRPGGADFAPSAHVFPGGSVHDADRDFPDTSRAAGLRELFEEVGILLARRPDGRFARQEDCERLRQLVDQGRLWPAALKAAGLVPAFDRLVFLTRWITPDRLVRRFDTRFFLARRPLSQQVRPQPGEVDEWLWVTPADALRGELTLVHATQRILEWVAAEPDAMLLFGRLRRRRRESPAIQPKLVELPDGGFRVVDPETVGKLPSAGKRQRQLSRQRS